VLLLRSVGHGQGSGLIFPIGWLLPTASNVPHTPRSDLQPEQGSGRFASVVDGSDVAAIRRAVTSARPVLLVRVVSDHVEDGPVASTPSADVPVKRLAADCGSGGGGGLWCVLSCRDGVLTPGWGALTRSSLSSRSSVLLADGWSRQ